MEIVETVRAIVASELDVEKEWVQPASRLIDDLDMDTDGLADIVICLEDEFDISISEDEEHDAATVSDLAALVERLTAGRTEEGT